MHVLVTGATGFTGGYLARALLARGQSVRVLVRDATKARDLGIRGADILVGDLQDARMRRLAVDGVDVVYNIAALYREAGLSAAAYRAVNASAAAALIAAAAEAGVRRVVHCSTVGVHGDIDHPPANENAPLKPGDIYQVTKLEGETLARETGQRTGIEVTIARPTGIYGPGDRRLLKVFRGVARRRFPMLGRGQIYYHLTYIDDLVEGFRLCGEHAAAANRTYILAGGEVTTLNELVALVAAAAGVQPPRLHLPVWPFWIAGAVCEAVCAPFGIEPPIYRRRVDFYTKSRAFDITRARHELGFHPQVGLKDGIARTLAWYREHEWIDLTPGVATPPIARAQDQLFAPGRSARQKYAALVVGRDGLGALLKYEFVIGCAQSRPGALGLALRRFLYPRLLGSCGRNVVFGQNVVVRHPHKIHIGDNVVVDDNCLLDAKGESNSGIRIGNGVFIGRNSILSCKNGDIELGDGANVGFNCEIFSASRVRIGVNVLLAAYVYVIGGDHDFADPSKSVLEQGRQSKGVTIGNGAWLGAGAKILDGVVLGDAAIVGAGAVVRDDVEARTIVAGIPARVIATR